MSPSPAAEVLVDRDAEIAVLDRLVAATGAGASGVLVLTGDPGVGKTTLLEHVITEASRMRVLRVGGVEAEFELPFAGLHQLLDPVLVEAGALPEAQRDALAGALGRFGGPAAESFLTALAVLTLFSNLSDDAPLLCVVDDAEFLDDASAQALVFAARRLESESILMLFGCGTEHVVPRFAGLSTLHIKGLSDAASGELLDVATGSRLDHRVRRRLISELDGNPLALLEIVNELTPAQVNGSAALPDALPLGERLESALLRQIRSLPEDSKQLLLVVAAERSGEPGAIWRAAERLGIAGSALAPTGRTLRTRGQITFRHGLVRTAVYTAATEQLRRETHLALAAAMHPVADWDRAAWHRGAAAQGPDETVAGELEAAAETAKERGGYRAAGAFLELAARLTPDAARRAGRTLGAADAQLSAGEVQSASTLLAEATAGMLDEGQRAQARRLRAALAVARGENGHTMGLLLEAARELAPFDAAQARGTYLQALMLALFAGRLGPRDGAQLAARAARAAPLAPQEQPHGADLLLEGYALRFTAGPGPAAPVLREAIDLIRDFGDLQAIGLAYQAAFELWDDSALQALATRRVDLSRATGALVELPNALTQLGAYEVLVGRFDVAEVWFEEAKEIARATGRAGILGDSEIAVLVLEAWRGREERTRALARICASDGTARGLGAFIGFAQYVLSVLELSLGNYRAALEAAQDACLDDLLVTRTLPELIEAAARSGELDVAADAVSRLEESAVGSGSKWGLGMLARSRALIADEGDAEPLYQEAIDHLKRCRAATHLARSQLVYGEWLRRMRRRRDAREQLRSAHELFESMGAEAFARRAQMEMAATGVRLRRRTTEPVRTLTPHEWRIATLVGEGASNADIAARLYISPRTVEYHLSKIYRKLDVNSRTQLTGALVNVDRDLAD